MSDADLDGGPERTEPAHASRVRGWLLGCRAAWARFGTIWGRISILQHLRLELLRTNGNKIGDHNRPNGTKGDCCQGANDVRKSGAPHVGRAFVVTVKAMILPIMSLDLDNDR